MLLKHAISGVKENVSIPSATIYELHVSTLTEPRTNVPACVFGISGIRRLASAQMSIHIRGISQKHSIAAR